MTSDTKEGPFWINYSVGGEHFMVGPYNTRRFAMVHIDDVRKIPGADHVFLGNRPPDDSKKSFRHVLPITATVAALSMAAICLAGIFDLVDMNFNPRSDAIKSAYHVVSNDIFM